MQVHQRVTIQTDTTRQKCSILHAVPKLSQSYVSFISPRVAIEADVADKVHGRTVRRVLNAAAYHYCKLRKKELLRAANLNAGHGFCRNIYEL